MDRDSRARAVAALWLLLLALWHAVEVPPAEAARTSRPYRVDVNRAEFDALALLPGLGGKRAWEIVRRREERPFRRLEELQEIRGIGPVTVESLLPYAEVGDVVLPRTTR